MLAQLDMTTRFKDEGPDEAEEDGREFLLKGDLEEETGPERLCTNRRLGRWRHYVFGNYDWFFLCTPTFPWTGERSQPPFFAKDDRLPLLLALVMGLQHALAMVGGIIVPPLLLTTKANFPNQEQQYLISAALISSGLSSLIHVLQIRIPRTSIVLGSGMLSVTGTAISQVPIALQALAALRGCSCDGNPCLTEETCNACTGTLSGDCLSLHEAFGRVLGTIFLTSWFQVALSFASPETFRRLFPPVVTGPSVILIGVELITSGISQWGGGTECASQVLSSKIPCGGNGEVELSFGDVHYVGLGAVVLITFVFIELFGSPFLRNAQVIVGLAVGMFVASVARVTRCDGDDCTVYRFVTGKKLSEAPWILPVYQYRYPFGVYLPAVLPLLVCSVTAVVGSVGDLTATFEASRMEPSGDEYEKSLRGTILCDGVNCLWTSLIGCFPTTTYAQNNGVIALSGCASRVAGYGCAFWLIFLGVLAKFPAMILTIPNCVLGAMTTFLFASISVSGVQILNTKEDLHRRDRFIVTMALGIGLGISLVPYWINISGQAGYPYEGNLWPIDPTWSRSYRGFRDAIILVLSNGFSAGALTALILNLILPMDQVKSVDSRHS